MEKPKSTSDNILRKKRRIYNALNIYAEDKNKIDVILRVQQHNITKAPKENR